MQSLFYSTIIRNHCVHLPASCSLARSNKSNNDHSLVAPNASELADPRSASAGPSRCVSIWICETPSQFEFYLLIQPKTSHSSQNLTLRCNSQFFKLWTSFPLQWSLSASCWALLSRSQRHSSTALSHHPACPALTLCWASHRWRARGSGLQPAAKCG